MRRDMLVQFVNIAPTLAVKILERVLVVHHGCRCSIMDKARDTLRRMLKLCSIVPRKLKL